MLREQKRRESNVMINGLVVLIVLLVKHYLNYEIPNAIIDAVVELACNIYIAYSIGNSPRIRGEY